MDDYVERAIALAKGGQTDAARDLLKAVVHRDADNLEAWRWIASLGRDDDERREALEQVLQLDPGDDWARQAMEKLQQRVQAAQAQRLVRPDSSVPLPPMEPVPADEVLEWSRLQLTIIAVLMLVFSVLVGGAGGAFAWALINGRLGAP